MTYLATIDNAISTLLEHQREGEKPFLVQIGAMDGSSFDPVHRHILDHSNLHGLLVEPVHMQALMQTYNGRYGLEFEEAAITEENGPCEMMRVRSDAPAWKKGGAHLKEGGVRHEMTSCDDLEEITVTGMTLQTLLDKHHVKRIDILQIDTEGMDYDILKQLDFKKYHPSIIHFEHALLDDDQKFKAKALLQHHGYLYILKGLDILAVTPELMQQMIPKGELTHYKPWVHSKVIDEQDLPYAVALLAELAGHLTGKFIDDEPNKPVRDQGFISSISFSSGKPRQPRFPEALDATNRLSMLFHDQSALAEFLQTELPKEAMHSAYMPGIMEKIW